MNYIFGAIGVVSFIVIISYFSKAQNMKRMRHRIRTQFGAVPNRKFVRENVRYLINSESQEYDIDEITWNDLDMDKVFSRINSCNSYIGEQVLYRKLHSTEHDIKQVENREKIIQRFLDDTKEREDVQVLLEKLGRRKISYYLPQFINEIDSFKIKNIWIYKGMTFLLVGTLLLGIILNESFLYASLIVFLINAILYTLGKHRFQKHLEMLGSVVGVVATANTLIKKYKLNEGELTQASTESAKRMRKTVNQIVFIQRKMETAMSGDIGALIIDYLIGSTLWDFHVYHKIVKLLTVNKDEFMKLYTYIGEIDAAISIASFRESIPHYCHGDFHEEKNINLTKMYHPLISNPVCNDVNMASNYIITGSNASGKSTYIKAVAINMILAQSINTVLAKSAKIPYANVLTSMAVRDDVTSGESYYMKEINYLKRIINQLNDNQLTICIVDEILRGTNTEERIAASVAILDFMSNKNCLAIVASHDIEVSVLLEEKFKNCHFSEVLDEEDVQFDYKVKMGVSKSKNAIKLLGHIGFPQEIVKHAEELVLQQ